MLLLYSICLRLSMPYVKGKNGFGIMFLTAEIVIIHRLEAFLLTIYCNFDIIVVIK